MLCELPLTAWLFSTKGRGQLLVVTTHLPYCTFTCTIWRQLIVLESAASGQCSLKRELVERLLVGFFFCVCVCDRVWAECCQPHRCPLYLIAGGDWRQRQMTEPSLDTALQPGARAVISSSGRGGDADSGCDHLQHLCRRRAASLSLRRKRRCFGAQWMCKPAQGSHGCLHWGVVTTSTHTHTPGRAARALQLRAREKCRGYIRSLGDFKAWFCESEGKCCTKHFKYVWSVFIEFRCFGFTYLILIKCVSAQF